MNKKEQLLEMARNGEPRPTKKHPLGAALKDYTRKRGQQQDPEFNETIRQLRPDWFVARSEKSQENKQRLLEMARNGEPKPKYRQGGRNKNSSDALRSECTLARLMMSYMDQKHGSYDPEFDEEIRSTRPDWFIDTAVENKKQLLEMARSGETRPNKHKSSLGEALIRYTKPKSLCYDSVFTEEIKKIAPKWFVFQRDVAQDKKRKLLEMAYNSEPRPYYLTHPLAGNLYHYTDSKSKCYDAGFDHTIRSIAPDWFVTQIDLANEKKKHLLERANSGGQRPISKKGSKDTEARLAQALQRYTSGNKPSYDPVFDEAIRKVAPHWFTDTAAEKKKILLEMAANNELKPSKNLTLGQALRSYLNRTHGAYDPKFKEEIKRICPKWCVCNKEKTDKNKQRLLEMARNGERRPVSGKTYLGNVLSNYIRNDRAFNQTIRKLAPQWFIGDGECAKVVIANCQKTDDTILQGIRERHKAELDAFTNQQSGILEGFVYIITNPAWSGMVKLGSAIDYEKRFASYQTSSPFRDYKLEYTHYFKFRRNAEEFVKKHFADRKVNGEWFSVSVAEAIGFIEKLGKTNSMKNSDLLEKSFAAV